MGRTEVERFYDGAASQYHEQYNPDTLYDTTTDYPANHFRLQILINSFLEKNVKRIIEVGVGEGTPLALLYHLGMDVCGFDISQEMVKRSRETIERHGLHPDRIFRGDIQDPTTYAHAVEEGGRFDGLVAMGVMPHVENDDAVLDNMAALVRPGGSIFIEFRNSLFSLFSFNRRTIDFIVNDLLINVSDDVTVAVRKELESRLNIYEPPSTPGYDTILSKFHNPFESVEQFTRHGFTDIKLHWYHYHPAMPYLENKMPDAFRSEAIRLEHEASGWRGYFLCSAFVVEAVKQ